MDIPTLPPSVLEALSASRRRAALAVLVEREGSVPPAELAAAVVEREAATSTDRPDVDEVSTSLHHVHLPTLSRVGTITYDPETGLAAVKPDSPTDCEWVRRLLADHPETAYDTVLVALASQRRQALLYTLLTEGSASEDDLAVAVAAHERQCEPGTVPESVQHVVGLSIRHTHLPPLADAGFVTTEDGTVRPEEMSWRWDPWVAESPIGEWAATE